MWWFVLGLPWVTSQILINTNINNYFQPRSIKKWLKHSIKPSGLQNLSPSDASHPSREQLPNSQSQTPSARLISSGSQGVLHSHTPSFTQKLLSCSSRPLSHSSKPPSNSHIYSGITSATTGSVNMLVNDYGGFHDKDESMERDFALQHQRTTSNSKVMCNT